MKKGFVIDPQKSKKIFTVGSADGKSQREINWLIDNELVGSEQFVGGLATFSPGMTAPLHAHSDAEEINVVLEGEGKLVTPEGVSLLKKGDWQFVPKGVAHSHGNTGEGPFTIVWLYSPPSKTFPKS